MKAMPSSMVRDILQGQLALALFGPHLAEAEQPRQAAIAVAVDGVGKQAGASVRSSRQPINGFRPTPVQALCIRTTPASVLRSAMPMAS